MSEIVACDACEKPLPNVADRKYSDRWDGAYCADCASSRDKYEEEREAQSVVSPWMGKNEALKDFEAFKQRQRAEPWGALLVRYGYDPYETESSARRVAEKAAEDISTLSQALHNMLVHMAALGIPCDEDSLVRARAAIDKVNRKSGGAS